MTNIELINETRNLNPYENLKKILGKKLGTNIYDIINRLELAENELDIVHKTLTDLYNLNDTTIPTIKKCLRKLDKLEGKKL